MERSSATQFPNHEEHTTGQLVTMLSEQVSVLIRDELAKVLTRAKAAELSGRVRRSQLLQRRWPVALAAGVLIAGSVAIWRWKKT